VPIIKECTTRLNLSSLVITGCLIKDGVIDNMVNCENIVRLDLSRNQLTGKGISKLAKKLQNVRDLNLGN
jgi:Ran GTPase-activating protein (RanGAP) involved in mRNA processing and transport